MAPAFYSVSMAPGPGWAAEGRDKRGLFLVFDQKSVPLEQEGLITKLSILEKVQLEQTERAPLPPANKNDSLAQRWGGESQRKK